METEIGDCLYYRNEYLQDTRFELLTRPGDIRSLELDLPPSVIVTGALVDGLETWATDYPAPWSLNAFYERIF